MIFVVCREHIFKDSFLFYRFIDDEQSSMPSASFIDFSDRKRCDEELADTLSTLSQVGPDACLRAILRKPYVSLRFDMFMYSFFFCAKTETFCSTVLHRMSVCS